MAKAQIVLVDTDEGYLGPLERKFVEEFKYDANIHVITDPAYLAEFFSVQQSIDIFVVSSDLYSPDFMRHNIQNFFVLSEVPPQQDTAEPYHAIYKYTSAKEIYDAIVSMSGATFAARLHSDAARVILLFSAGGGLGQTTIAAGLASVLAQNFRRVLFISMDSLQTFGAFMQSDARIKLGSEKPLLSKSDYVYEAIKPFIVAEMFDFLPPFDSAPASLGIEAEHIIHLIDCIKKAGDYDFVIVDAPNELSKQTTKMMAYANQTIVVTAQDALSVYKLDCLLDNIDFSDPTRFWLVCNLYRSEQENFLISGQNGRNHPKCEYIRYANNMPAGNCAFLAALPDMKKIGQLFL